MFCKNCGQPVNPGQAICLCCGVKVGEGNVFCENCGAQVAPGAEVCINCGYKIGGAKNSEKNTIDTIIKVLMIISCVCLFWTIVPIPLTVITLKKMENGEEISTGLAVCNLLFNNMIAGILLLMRK